MNLTHGWRTRARWMTTRAAAATATALSLSLLVTAIPGSPAVAPVRAQFASAPMPGVTIYGSGEASAPAETATVQLLIGQGGRQFGFSQDGSGGSSFESGGEVVSTVELVPVATPEASADGVAVESAESEGRRGRRGRPEPQPITAERLAPVIAAVATSAGIEPSAVTVNLSPLATEPFGGRQRSARLDFDVAQPTPAGLTDLIAAASDAAAGNGMVIEVAGVLHNPADCAAIEDEAATAAIEDANAQADRLAGLLGITLGDVIGVNSDPFFVGFLGPGQELAGCTGQQSAFYDSSYGGLGTTVPVFDPSAPAEVEVYAVLVVSYEIVESDPA
ncbi:MAG: SIMPL domain-containing protein [Thermomicrobiales bacterium]